MVPRDVRRRVELREPSRQSGRSTAAKLAARGIGAQRGLPFHAGTVAGPARLSPSSANSARSAARLSPRAASWARSCLLAVDLRHFGLRLPLSQVTVTTTGSDRVFDLAAQQPPWVAVHRRGPVLELARVDCRVDLLLRQPVLRASSLVAQRRALAPHSSAPASMAGHHLPSSRPHRTSGYDTPSSTRAGVPEPSRTAVRGYTATPS